MIFVFYYLLECLIPDSVEYFHMTEALHAL